MTTLFLNMKGLGKLSKIPALGKFVDFQNLNIIMIQETMGNGEI